MPIQPASTFPHAPPAPVIAADKAEFTVTSGRQAARTHLHPRPDGAPDDRQTSSRTCTVGIDARCRTVRSLTVEMLALSADRVSLRRDRRDSSCKIRQIAMYVCHVALRMPMVEVGRGFGRDRTTVSHACHVIEDRRDEPQFDALLSAIERIATMIFPPEESGHA